LRISEGDRDLGSVSDVEGIKFSVHDGAPRSSSSVSSGRAQASGIHSVTLSFQPGRTADYFWNLFQQAQNKSQSGGHAPRTFVLSVVPQDGSTLARYQLNDCILQEWSFGRMKSADVRPGAAAGAFTENIKLDCVVTRAPGAEKEPLPSER
jgi:hypothetical protein